MTSLEKLRTLMTFTRNNLSQSDLFAGTSEWHVILQDNYDLHKVVELALARHEPKSLEAVFWEWPHESEQDASRLAYTRQAGQADRQVVTSIGKYLKRHWPSLPDHVIRDLQTLQHTFDYVTYRDIKDFIYVVCKGPESCMAPGRGHVPFSKDDEQEMDNWRDNPDEEEPYWKNHPYACYDPKYGWSLATRELNGSIDGRALLLEHEGTKTFVRSFARGASSYSETDHALEAWLKGEGWSKKGEWPEGAKLARIDHPLRGYLPMVPYLDGDSQNIYDEGDYLVIASRGDLVCDNQDGTPSIVSEEEEENTCRCSDCGDTVYLDNNDHLCVGQDEDRVVCESCAESYKYVTGRPGRINREYNVHEDNASVVWGSNKLIDEENPPGFAVNSEDKGWALLDLCWVDSYGDYYSLEKAKVVYEDAYYSVDACWQCESTGIWYPDTVCNAGGYLHKFHEESLERVSSDAEWGDIALAYNRKVAEL